jgi:hypothetical protein
VRSSLATGLFTPDSRICLEENATPAFRQTWTEMCRTSFDAYQNYLGLPGDPVEWIDLYFLSDGRPSGEATTSAASPKFAELRHQLVPDLVPEPEAMPLGASPFAAFRTRHTTNMMFNLTEYSRVLMSDFLENGGRIQTREFHSPADFAALPQRTLINATGYGARALFGDESITPVRGQLTRLIPQPEVRYGVVYNNVSLVPRRDGLVVQAFGPDEGFGFGDASTTPDRAEAEQAVATIARLFGGRGAA